MALNSPLSPPPSPAKKKPGFWKNTRKKVIQTFRVFILLYFVIIFFNFLNFSSFLTRMGESGILWPVASLTLQILIYHYISNSRRIIIKHMVYLKESLLF